MFGKGVRSNPIFELITCFSIVLLHPLFVMLLGVAYVAFTGVRACVFVHYHSVSTDVAVFAFAVLLPWQLQGSFMNSKDWMPCIIFHDRSPCSISLRLVNLW